MIVAADEAKTITKAIATAMTVCSTLLIGTGGFEESFVAFSGRTVSNVDSSMYGICQDNILHYYLKANFFCASENFFCKFGFASNLFLLAMLAFLDTILPNLFFLRSFFVNPPVVC